MMVYFIACFKTKKKKFFFPLYIKDNINGFYNVILVYRTNRDYIHIYSIGEKKFLEFYVYRVDDN